ncbi:MAG: MFS transporter [Siculibacillus sp.]|nr:MFS transporter [Siculibacillus sp.]
MAPRDDRSRVLALTAIFSTAATVATGLALGLPLLALVLEARGVSGTLIGLNTAVAGLASLLVPLFVTPLARMFGAARLLIGSIAVVAATFWAFRLVDDLAMWFVLRALFHGALTIAFVVSEFWLMTVSPPEKRGLMVGIYATVFSFGLAAGPIVLSLTGSEGALPFAVGALVLAGALAPVWIAGATCPRLEHAPTHSPVGYVVAAPIATLGVLAFGAVESGGLSFLPLWGLATGLDETRAAWLLTSVGLGNVLLQIPIGLLADRHDKIRLLALVSLVGVVGAAALPFTAENLALTLAVLFVWGGTIAGLYTVGLSALADRFAGSDLAGANAAFVAMYGVGMLVGPAAIGVGLDLAPRTGAPMVMAAFFALHLAAVVVLAPRRRV